MSDVNISEFWTHLSLRETEAFFPEIIKIRREACYLNYLSLFGI